MKKRFIVDKEIKELDLNEVLELAKPLIVHMCSKYTNTYTHEEFEQEGYITAWKCYDTYDITRGASFLTYLNWKLRQKFGQLLTAQTRQKRTLQKGFSRVYLDCPIEQEKNDFHSLIGYNGFEEDIISKVFIDNIMSNVSEYEARLFPVLVGRMSGVELANIEGSTRQNISNQVSRLKKKLKNLLKEV